VLNFHACDFLSCKNEGNFANYEAGNEWMHFALSDIFFGGGGAGFGNEACYWEKVEHPQAEELYCLLSDQ